MGSLNCSCGGGQQSDQNNEIGFITEDKKMPEDILKEIKSKFEQSINSIEAINQEEFDQELNTFPNGKKLIEAYDSQITDQSSKNLPTVYQTTLNNDSKDKDLIELSNPIKFSDEDGNFDLFKGSVNKNYELTGKGYRLTNNYLYYGNFQNNEFNGKGIMINKDGSSLFGDWVNGMCTGKGVLKISNKLEYNGDFVENKKHGYGIEKYPDGSRYEGEFQDNKKNGKGKCIISNGETYEGDFKDDLFNGEGKYRWPKESREYIGHFKNGNMDGKGINKFKDGSVYEGYYKNGLKHGLGKYSWPNGKVFYGSWLNNKLHGNGYYEMDNEKYNITFRFGKIISTRKAEDSDDNKRIKFGYDNIVDKENNDCEKYICPLCNFILYQPQKCCSCLKNYCHDCIKGGKEDKKCISCGKNEYEDNLDLLHELMSKVKINCNVCQTVMDYKTSLNHYHS